MELQERNDFNSVLETASWEMILVQTKAQSPSIAQNSSLLASVQRLEPALIQMNNFATIIAVLCGADAKTAALIWGSIRTILGVSHIIFPPWHSLANRLS
jgi:hypothetical protein